MSVCIYCGQLSRVFTLAPVCQYPVRASDIHNFPGKVILNCTDVVQYSGSPMNTACGSYSERLVVFGFKR
jgi:hypothetical protein